MPKDRKAARGNERLIKILVITALYMMAEPTGLEPATSDVTGRRSNQLNYDSALSNSLLPVIGTVGLEPTTFTL